MMIFIDISENILMATIKHADSEPINFVLSIANGVIHIKIIFTVLYKHFLYEILPHFIPGTKKSNQHSGPLVKERLVANCSKLKLLFILFGRNSLRIKCFAQFIYTIARAKENSILS